MTRQIDFDRIANSFAERYVTFLGSIRAAYQSRLLNRNVTYASIHTFEKEANAIATLYLEREINEVTAMEMAIKSFIQSDCTIYDIKADVLNDDNYLEYLDDFTKFVYNSIKQQVSKDILFAAQHLRVDALKLINSNHNHVTLLLNYKDLEFSFTDKMGRNLASKKYIRTLVRDYCVKAYNDLFAENLDLNNIDQAIVDNPDHTHSHYGTIVTINDNENELNYFNVREDIFHPNTNSILKPIGA